RGRLRIGRCGNRWTQGIGSFILATRRSMNFLLRRSGIVLTSLLFATAFAPSFDPLLAQTPHVLKGATEHAAQPSALIAIPAKLPDQDSADDRPCFTLDGRQMYFGSRRASKDAWRAPDNSIFKDPSWKW